MGEDDGLCGEAVEGGELEGRKAMFVDLAVGELVEYEPDDAWMQS